MAHGSRRQAANEEFCKLVEQISTDASNYRAVIPCFLELAEPSLNDACQQAVNEGCDSVDLYPLFFNAGKHVDVDIPQLLQDAKERFPDLECRQLAYFGSNERMADIVLSHVNSQR